MHTKSIILISTADWDHPLWTNKQHVACSLADMGFRILYVESLGIRPIRFKSNDFLRIFEDCVGHLRFFVMYGLAFGFVRRLLFLAETMG